MNREETKKRIEEAKKIQEEFQKQGGNINPIWMLLAEVRGFRSEMRALLPGLSFGIIGSNYSPIIVMLNLFQHLWLWDSETSSE